MRWEGGLPAAGMDESPRNRRMERSVTLPMTILK